ncbi:hypothetical protein LOZ12_003184 [Ophidiomyces ophidiicola]|uniref:Uncharacterized protein n=1 Tax=Ophidiomyces ophidiicola TaxID=1387563 RepID=A0ACB8V017_9EURO|nr:hypothetical protein LOZ61_002783 [Ophidiomyces ophidiicola]KAI1919668.1 hypothetical protein LOZ64_002176 [Ophidiomyces ophidiicola]KAI1928111.1 hypothetical protein LOZ60_002604 [Ophidiomyces ophidiicola]KAI1945384.1 hypothetical protein LOZ62_003787 [Ophidiomyces ophidiicola]KAI1956497.1 hypothetical protein LOZ59_004282 [Ophidiomyces ophidiicola]
MSEDQNLMARIGHLAGQINQHKNQLAAPSRGVYSGGSPYGTHGGHHRGYSGWAPYRGRGRPASRRPIGPHRHRTLVLNNSITTPDTTSTAPSASISNDEKGDPKTPQQNGWVAKRDRHMQLINTAIYDQEAQARAKAIEETRKIKAQKRAERDKTKVLQFAQHAGGPVSAPDARVATAGANSYRIVVQDIPFQITKGGSKLIRLSSEGDPGFEGDLRAGLPLIDDPSTASTTPKKVTVGGVIFVRSKNGNLHRLGAVVSKKKNGVVPATRAPGAPTPTTPTKLPYAENFSKQVNAMPALHAISRMNLPQKDRQLVCISSAAAAPTPPVDTRTYASPLEHPSAVTLRFWDSAAKAQSAWNAMCTSVRTMRTRASAASRKPTDMEGVENDEEDISSEEDVYDEIDSDDVDSDELEDDESEEIIPDTVSGVELTEQQDFVRF